MDYTRSAPDPSSELLGYCHSSAPADWLQLTLHRVGYRIPNDSISGNYTLRTKQKLLVLDDQLIALIRFP
jgi:hypothetical protein